MEAARDHGAASSRGPAALTSELSDARLVSRCRGGEHGKLGPGDYFGEIALIDDGARSATITADSDLHCYGLTSWEFRPLVEANASIAWKLLETMAQRLRAAQQR